MRQLPAESRELDMLEIPTAKAVGRLAWVILLTAFVAFWAVVISAPKALDWFVAQATVSAAANLEPIEEGTVLVTRQATTIEIRGTRGMAISAGDTVRADRNSHALLTFFDGSIVELRQGSNLTLIESRASRFNNNQSQIALRLIGGRYLFSIGPSLTAEREIVLSAREAQLHLDDGSYAVDVGRDRVVIEVRAGEATVGFAGQTVVVGQGQQIAIEAGGNVVGPNPIGRDLIVNGDFREGLRDWNWSNRDEEGPRGTVAVIPEDGFQALRIWREGVGHAETYAVQRIDRDVSDLQWLRLALDFKLVRQSLSGGGIAGSEYPLHLRLRYRDLSGREWVWGREFYFQNEANNPTSPTSQRILPDTWYHFEADLLTSDVVPRPSYIVELEVVASGHTYESQVENIRLFGG